MVVSSVFFPCREDGEGGRLRRRPTCTMSSKPSNCLHWAPRSLVEHNPAGTGNSEAMGEITRAEGDITTSSFSVGVDNGDGEGTEEEGTLPSGHPVTSDYR